MKDEGLEIVKREVIRNQKVNKVTFALMVACAFVFAVGFASESVVYSAVRGTLILAVGLMFILSATKSELYFNSIFFIVDHIDRLIHRKTLESKIVMPSRYNLLRLSEILFSAETQKEVFLEIMADWDEEICQVLKENEGANLLMINIRHIYAFLMAIWQKSPIGDLIEIVIKIAKP